jgi:hypothetical protein
MNKQQPTVLPMHWVLWMSFAMSVLLYGGLGFYLRSQAVPKEGTETTVMAMMLVGLGGGIVASLMATLGTPIAAARIPTWQGWHIIRMTFAELPALFGFAAFYIGGSELGFTAMLAWSMGLMLLVMPTVRDREAWDEHKKLQARGRRG